MGLKETLKVTSSEAEFIHSNGISYSMFLAACRKEFIIYDTQTQADVERVLCDERREGGWDGWVTDEEIEAACAKISTVTEYPDSPVRV